MKAIDFIKRNGRKIGMAVTTAAITAVTAISSFAEETSAVSDISTAMTTGLETVKGDIMGFVVTVLPIALGIAGTVLAVKFGWSFFKKIGGKA